MPALLRESTNLLPGMAWHGMEAHFAFAFAVQCMDDRPVSLCKGSVASMSAGF